MPKISELHQSKIRKIVSRRTKTRHFVDLKFPNTIVRDYGKEIIKEVNLIDNLIKEILFPHLEKITNTKDERLDRDIDFKKLAGVALVAFLIRKIKSRFFGERLEEDQEPSQRLFTESIRRISSKFLNQANSFGEKKFVNEFERQTGTKPLDRHLDVEEFIKDATRKNISLIKTIPQRYFSQVQTLIEEAVNRGQLTVALQRELLQIKETTKNSARLISRDQIGKLVAVTNEARQRNLSVTHYIWRTSEDGRVRSFSNSKGFSDHARLNGTLISWSRPPQTVFKGKRSGEHNHAGMDIQCFPKGTMIKTEKGEKPIEKIKIGNIVHSHWGLQKVIETHVNHYKGKLIGIKFLHKTIWLTPGHKLFINGKGWVSPECLKIGDKTVKLEKFFTCNFFHKESARNIKHPHPHLISQEQMSIGVDFTHGPLNFNYSVKFVKHKIGLIINAIFPVRFFKNPLRVIFNTKNIKPSGTYNFRFRYNSAFPISTSRTRGGGETVFSSFRIFDPLSCNSFTPVSYFNSIMNENPFYHSTCHPGNFSNITIGPKFINIFFNQPFFKWRAYGFFSLQKMIHKKSFVRTIYRTIDTTLIFKLALNCFEFFRTCFAINFIRSFPHRFCSKIINNVFKRHLHYEVVGLESQEFDGYVYNFGVDKSMSYFAEGILVENCRCGAQAVFDDITGIEHPDTKAARKKSISLGLI